MSQVEDEQVCGEDSSCINCGDQLEEFDTDKCCWCCEQEEKKKVVSNLKVQGNHIQHILNKILGIPVGAMYTGKPGKQDEYITYELTDGAIATDESTRIDIHYFYDYTLTVRNNLFTFPIVSRFNEKYIMKVLTDEQQKRILSYLGF
jgi:hypothetical protein